LALFGRRPQERVDRLVNPASENLRITALSDVRPLRRNMPLDAHAVNFMIIK
jgi:hypothetical protein